MWRPRAKADNASDTNGPLPWDLVLGDRFLGTGPTVDMGSHEYLNTNGILGDPEPPTAAPPAPAPSGTACIAFTYDALGRRIEKIVDSGEAQVEVTRYYYDGQTLDTTLLPGADGSHRDPAALLRAASQGFMSGCSCGCRTARSTTTCRGVSPAKVDERESAADQGGRKSEQGCERKGDELARREHRTTRSTGGPTAWPL